MPELPEVETIVQTLIPVVKRRVFIDCKIYNQQTVQGNTTLEKSLGYVIGKPFRRGKLIVLPLLNEEKLEYMLCVHLKMTGKLLVFSKDTKPGVHTRIVWSLNDGNMLFFDDIRKFGYVRLISPNSLASWPFWNTLGPEPFDINSITFAQRLKKYRGMIKVLLLNQKVIAGCGNIYADESLFRAKILPHTQVSQLSIKILQQLHEALKEVFLESIAACGSSIKDYCTVNGSVGSFQNMFYVYGRVNQPCIICSTKLTGEKLGGRMTVWCSHCQS